MGDFLILEQRYVTEKILFFIDIISIYIKLSLIYILTFYSMMRQKLTALLFLLLFIFSCWKDIQKENINSQNNNISNVQIEKDSDFFSDIMYSDNQEDIKENFSNLVWEDDLINLQKTLDASDFVWTQKVIEKIISSLKKNTLSHEEKQKVKSLNNVYLSAMLNEGNYLYKQEEKSKQATEYLENEILKDPDFIDPFYNNYYLWYAQEIVKNYEGALKYYDEALKYAWDVAKNQRLKSVIYNQIWHVYDLSWDLEKAYKNYYEAYKLDNLNLYSASNIWRYFSIKWNFIRAKEFYEHASFTNNKAEKAEAYFNLSSIELRLWNGKPDINTSIEYAKKSIAAYKEYPMWYIALARGYYMLNDSKYNKDIEENLNRAIQLNPSAYLSYRYYWMYYLDNGNFEKFNEYIDKSSQVVENDPILMEHNKDYILLQNDMLKIFFQVDLWEYKELYEGDEYFKAIIEDQMQRKDFWLYKKFKTDMNFVRFYSEIKK